MKLAFTVVAAVMSLALSVSAVPAPQATNGQAPQPTSTPAPQPTNTPVPQATNTPVPQATNTPAPQATNTPASQATNTPAPQATNTAQGRSSDVKEVPVGGGKGDGEGGAEFDDTPNLPTIITKVDRVSITDSIISVTDGEVTRRFRAINQVRVRLFGADGVNGDVENIHGSEGDSEVNTSLVDLTQGELVNSINITVVEGVVAGLTMGTNKGKTSSNGDIFGDATPFSEAGTITRFSAPGPDFGLIGFNGRAGTFLNSLGPIWGKF